MIQIAFRLDDPSETSHQGVEAGIIDVLREHRVAATFATIPFRMIDGEFTALSASRSKPLVDAAREGVVEIALHGYSHTRQQPEPALPSEFSGRLQNEQHALIAEGKRHIEHLFGQPVRGFIPPWNSYDMATLQCVEALGFQYLSAGWMLPKGYAGNVSILPRTVHLNNLSAAMREAQRFSRANPMVIVVMHHADFAEAGFDQALIDMKGFSAEVGRLAKQPDVVIRSLTDFAANLKYHDCALRQQRLMNRHRLLTRLLPAHCFLDASMMRGMISGALGKLRKC